MALTRDMIENLRTSRVQEMQTLRQELRDIQQEYRQAETLEEKQSAVSRRHKKKEEIRQAQIVNECLREIVRAFQMANNQ